jgi:glutathione S-transferase
MDYDVISGKTCPYVQRVLIVLEEKGVSYTHKTIDLKNKPNWFMKISPFGKVPLLRLENGTNLFESQAINEFLDEVEGTTLHPSNAVERAEHRAWIEFISSIIMSFGGYYYATDEETANERLATVSERLARLEEVTSDGPYFSGSSFSLVDAAAAPLFSRVELLNHYHPINLLTEHPKLAAWSKSLLKHPSVAAIATSSFQEDVLSALRGKDVYVAQFLHA